MNALYLVGFIQSLFISSLILLKRKKALTDYLLSFYILVIGFFLFFIYADGTGFLVKNPYIVILDILYWVLIGPLLFLYIDLITSVNGRLKKKHLIHLLPTIIVFAGFEGYFFQTEVGNFFQYNPNTLIHKIAFYVWYYNSPFYYIICLGLLYHHSRKIKNYYSYCKNVDLKWLHYLAHGFAAVLVFGLISGLMSQYFDIELPFGSKHYTWLVMVLYIFGMGYFGYRQKGLFGSIEMNGNFDQAKMNSLRVFIEDNSYQKSGLSEEDSILLSKHLNEFMQNQKPYLDCELNLRELALHLETTPHKLSQVINEQMNCNFYEYINAFRIDEVKRALVHPDNKDYKIMAIAYDCGFNSKSTFYTLFKKHTSKTPSEYREELIFAKEVS